MSDVLRIGSRGSRLALIQSEWVRDELQALHAGLRVEIEVIHTKGDRLLDAPLAKIGDKGLFTKELETAMLQGRTDLSVHSAKDMPTEIPEGLAIVAFTRREDVRDVFVARATPDPGEGPAGDVAPATPRVLADLPDGARVGSSSLRRRSQLLALRPDLELVDIRGNVQTRLRKVEEQGMAGTILAAAGLARLEQPQLAAFGFAFEEMLPAVGQGSLAIEARADDERVARLVEPLVHAASALAVRAERSLMHALEGGCQVPIAAYAELVDGDGEARESPAPARLRRFARRAARHARRAHGHRRRPRGPGPASWPTSSAPPGPTPSWPRSAARRRVRRRRTCPTAPMAHRTRPRRAPSSMTEAAFRPLAGMTVVVTRPREQAASLAEPLEALGADVLLVPTIRIVPRAVDDQIVRAVVSDLADYRLVVFTSANAVQIFLGYFAELGAPVSSLDAATIAAIGPATASALDLEGVACDVVADDAVQEGLLAALAEAERSRWPARACSSRVPVRRATCCPTHCARRARWSMCCRCTTRWRSRLWACRRSRSRRPTSSRSHPAALCTGSSTLMEASGAGRPLAERLSGVRLSSIGPVTSETLRECGLPVAVEATEHTSAGLVAAIAAAGALA